MGMDGKIIGKMPVPLCLSCTDVSYMYTGLELTLKKDRVIYVTMVFFR